ncbi:MAG: hypothetical protein SO141_03980 [Alphaproteobacteria bacterium]|nr:hypothetical protein [Alphaproteobacteria bacterium]
MSKLWSKIILGLVTAFVIGISNANAELTCVAQPSCAMLGYSKTNVPNCTGYIHCPFDTSYKKCVTLDHTEGKCTGYSLADCPPHAKCEPCGSYKISSCADGYKVDGDTCICATVCADRLTQKDIPLNAGPIKQSCNACGAVSDIITGWECNSGYVNISGECKQAYSGCEAAGYLSDRLANATCEDRIVYTHDGSALRCYTNCTCNEGFIEKDHECVEFIDCSAYTLKTCPENATCSTCTDNYDNTTHKFEKCNSGYKEQSGVCVCEKVCSDTFTGTIPANGTAVKEACTACGITSEIVTGFTCKDGYVKKDGNCVPKIDCSSYPLSACPDNATCSKCTDNDGNSSYRFDNCNSGYKEQSGICVCEKVCSDTFTGTVPENATLKTETCTACGVSTIIKIGYSCNNGYSDKNGACVCSTVCENTYTGAIPENASATTKQCTACGKTTTITTGFTCNGGYNKQGNSCVCAKVCKDTYTGGIPANAKALTELCTACGETSEIIIGFTCNSGYNQSGNSCVCAKTCADTYTGSIPANATATTEQCTACGVSSTIITGYTCKSGYEGNDCHCSKVCSDTYTGSIPTNATATKETCVACGVSKSIVTGWTCNTGYMKVGNTCEKIIDCSSHTLASCPSHANCSQCTDNSGKTTYRFESCTSEYTLSGGVCVCAKTCADVVTTKPANSTFTTEVCTACGSSTTIKTGWACNNGYTKQSGACVCATTCADKVSSKPANSSFTTEVCTACGVSSTIKTGWTCNSGYVESGNSCVCAKTCADTYTGSLPDNAYYTTETCTACGINTTIKTGWACNSGYHKSGNSCVCDVTCNDTYTGTKPTNASWVYDNCTACGVTTKIKTDYECYAGYEGSDCHCATTCIDKISSKPSHSDYDTVRCDACGNVSYIKTGFTCHNGYEGSDCHCATTCTDKVSSKPANSSFTTEVCTACGVSSTIKTGWKCDDGYKEQSSTCVCATTCTDKISDKPANASWVYGNCTACGVSSRIKTGFQCLSGYTGSDCHCATTCADTYTGTLPAYAHYDTETCTACGVSTTIKTGWSCNSGYVKVGNTCQKYYNSCSAAGYLSSPKSNATCSTVSVYTSSGSTMTCYSGCTCNSGYTGDPCVCATTCNDKVTSKPDNASYTYESCTACGSSYSIKSGWTCNSGYVESGNSCVCPSGTYSTKAACENANSYSNCTIDVKCYKPTSCKSGYAKSASACGSKSGWKLGTTTDAFGCHQCNKKECPTIKVKYPIYGSSSGSAAFTYRNVKATTNGSEAACGTLASKGWSTVLTGSYSGDDACWVCEPKFCPFGYSTDKTSIADCGDSSLWSFNLASTAAGDDLCGKCTRKTTTCPSGYTAGLNNVSKCGSSGAKGWTLKTQGNCGKCVAKECVAGMSENTTGEKVSGVPLGSYEKSYYFDFSPNAYYTGDARCGTFTLKPEEICADYIRNKKSCGNGLDYDDFTYNNIFEACEAGGYADCTSLYDCIKGINANWKVYDLNYCSLCGGASDDGIACM